MSDFRGQQEPWANIGITGKVLLLAAHHTKQAVSKALQPFLQTVNTPYLSNSNCFWLQTPRTWLAPALACLAATTVNQCQLNLESSFLSRHQSLRGFKGSPTMTHSPIRGSWPSRNVMQTYSTLDLG